MLKPKGPYCQSCGLPLANDACGGGTEADGTKSLEYCSQCYVNGQFTEPTITAEEITEKVTRTMRRMKVPDFIVKLYTRDIPSLRRWAQSQRQQRAS